MVWYNYRLKRLGVFMIIVVMVTTMAMMLMMAMALMKRVGISIVWFGITTDWKAQAVGRISS